MKIININEKYGMPVEFDGEDLIECLERMTSAIMDCGYDMSYALVDGIDYEVID